MDKGKVREAILDRSVFKIINHKRPEVLCGAGMGIDASMISMEDKEVTVISTNPVTYTFKGMEKFAIAQVVNGIAAMGGEPVGVTVTILFPTALREIKLKALMKELENACANMNLQILGGHTEVTDAVIRPVVSVTGVGSCNKRDICSVKNIKPGMDIVMSKWIALPGTMMIIDAHREELEKRFQKSFLDRMSGFEEFYSVQSEAAVAVNSGVKAMHDIGRGGVKGALWEMASGADVGLEIMFDKIPVKQETIEVCEYYGLNPYEMLSTGALLMVTDKGNKLVSSLEHQGIESAVIGRTTADNDRVMIKNEERRFLTPSRGDEIEKI